MSRNSPFALVEPAPMVVGTGLVALDVVMNRDGHQAPRLWAGGTCGNVLTSLSYLGWQAYPVARLNKDTAAEHLLRDLRQWGVHLQFVHTRPGGNTPIIVQQRRHSTAGKAFHTFSWRCPQCGAFFPHYKAMLASDAGEIATRMAPPQVFFLDRVSRGALLLAQASVAQGALVVFEPSSIGEPHLFREALALTHILKYSHERLEQLGVEALPTGPLVEIKTLGEEGLHYRSRLPLCASHGWERLTAYAIDHVEDATGAGDWCTAGIIHRLGQTGLQGLLQVTSARLRDTFSFAQALAAWNCGFEGARGGMYSVSKEGFRSDIAQVMSRNRLRRLSTDNARTSVAIKGIWEDICPTCRPSESSAVAHAE